MEIFESELNQTTIWICFRYHTYIFYCSSQAEFQHTAFLEANLENGSFHICHLCSSFLTFASLFSPFLSTLIVELDTNMYCATRPSNNNTRPPRLCTNRTHNRHHRSYSSQSNGGPSMGSTHQCISSKPCKRSLPDDMAFFALPNKINNQFLAAPSLRNKKSTNRFPNGDIDISSDLEISFASNVSLNSPPRHNVSLASECEPMDISPAPPVKPPVVSTFEIGIMRPARPRAFTSGARLFGADISNASGQDKNLMPSPSVDQNPPLGSVRSISKKIQRSALPTEWLAPNTVWVVCIDFFFFRQHG